MIYECVGRVPPLGQKALTVAAEYCSPQKAFFSSVYLIINISTGSEFEFAPLQLVQIYFDTATYDETESSLKMTLEAQLGVIGGTMGLLTGFSIISGIEIVYFAAKLFMSLRIFRNDLKTNVNSG